MKRIESQSLREQALSAIRAGIVLGEIRAGLIYSAPSLALRLGVSATPVREAMLDLVSDGIVMAVRNKGFRVVELTDHDLDEIFQLRLLLEVPSLGEIAGKLDTRAIQAAEKDILAMQDAMNAVDLKRFVEADLRFHLGLLRQVGNGRLVEMVDRLRERARLYGLSRLLEEGELAETTAEHRRILDALIAGDRRLVEGLMRKHLKHTRGVWAGRRENHSLSPSVQGLGLVAAGSGPQKLR